MTLAPKGDETDASSFALAESFAMKQAVKLKRYGRIYECLPAKADPLQRAPGATSRC